MDAIRLLERAQDWTGAIVSGVRADDLTENTPCSEWDVATLLDHLIAEQETFNRVASGEALDLVASFDPNAPENKGRGWPDPGTTFEQLVKEAREI